MTFWCYKQRQQQLQKVAEMAYTYYYPYFSARSVVPSSKAQLQSKITVLRRQQLRGLRPQIQRAEINKQQKTSTIMGRQKEEQFKVRECLNELCEQQRIKAEVIASRQRQKVFSLQLKEMQQQNYFKNISKLSIQRTQLQSINAKPQRYGENDLKHQEKRIRQQQQHSHLTNLQGNKQNLQKNQKGFDKNKSNIVSHHLRQQEQHYQKHQGKQQKAKIKYQANPISFCDPAIIPQIYRSTVTNQYLNTLEAEEQTKQSMANVYAKGYSSCRKGDGNQLKNIKKVYPQQNRCSNNKSAIDKAKNQAKSFLNEPLQSHCLKKIEKRLKLASKRRKNEKKDLNHLFDTYKSEVRYRKDIKNKIYNHPIIIKKHYFALKP